MAKKAYKELYEEAIRDLNQLNLIIANLENEIKEKNKLISTLNDKIKASIKINENKNKLRGIRFKSGFFWKDGIKYASISEIFQRGEIE